MNDISFQQKNGCNKFRNFFSGCKGGKFMFALPFTWPLPSHDPDILRSLLRINPKLNFADNALSILCYAFSQITKFVIWL